jgi:hypothetical protein
LKKLKTETTYNINVNGNGELVVSVFGFVHNDDNEMQEDLEPPLVDMEELDVMGVGSPLANSSLPMQQAKEQPNGSEIIPGTSFGLRNITGVGKEVHFRVPGRELGCYRGYSR